MSDRDNEVKVDLRKKPLNPLYWYPGESRNQVSQQGQSWVDAGRDASNFIRDNSGNLGTMPLWSGDRFPQTETFLDRPVPANLPGSQEISSFLGNLWNKASDFYTEKVYPNSLFGRIQQGLEDRGFSGVGDLLGRSVDNMLYGAGTLFRGGEQAPSPSDIVSGLPTDTGVEQAPASDALTFQKYLDMYGGQFDNTPYDEAAQYMMDRRRAQLEAIQGMYNDYANEAAANAARVADIYAGAERGIGETYGGARSETEAAYQSAQQQAADQMARLGIEDAAAMTMPSQALSQSEALANLIANQASGESAIQRYGATGGDFASSMAQIAQQQAVENQRSASEQLADQLFELEMQRAQAQAAYDPYARALSRIEAEQSYNEMVNPPVDTSALQAEADFLYQQEQDDANRFQDFYFKYLDDSNYDQPAARAKLLDDIQSGFLGPRLQQWVANNPDMVQQITG